MPHLELDGVRVFYADTGGRGAAVVFSHGLLMDHEMFAPQVAALSSEFRCIAWDERGHGATESAGSFTYWDSARDLLGLLDHLGIRHAFLVGMSQGGFVSLRAALVAPERVRALAFIDSHAGAEDPEMIPAYQAMVDAWMAQPTRELAETVAAIILGPADHDPWIEKWLARPPDAIKEPYDALMSREDLHYRLGEVGCPALVIHGEDDTAISLEKAHELCEGLPRCEGLVRIPEAGHASNLSHPGIVTEALRDFFRRHSA